MRVAPFKPQNMSNNAAACADGGEIGRAQAVQGAGGWPCAADGLQSGAEAADRPRLAGGRARAAVGCCMRPTTGRGAPADGRGHGELRAPGRGVRSGDRGGRGHAAEVNLRAGDIANMGFARRAEVPVCLVGDIDRGRVIASLVGTGAVLDGEDRALIAGS